MTTITTKYPFVGSVDTRQGGRNENQDNAGFVDTPLGLLLVVCDGMGGGPGGRTASMMAVDTILNVLSEVSEHTPREDALRFAIDKANDIIYSKAIETAELRGMGTTIAAMLINEESAVIAHAGDTRVYQLRKGTIVYRSTDHSVVANLVRQKRLTEEEARNHPQSNVVTRALGIRPSMEVEFDEVSFHKSDRFVICTDGIWGMMPQRDLVRSLSRVMGINELCEQLTAEIDKIGHEQGGGHDNMTLAVLDTTFDSDKKRNHRSLTNINLEKGIKLCLGVIVPLVIAMLIWKNNSGTATTDQITNGTVEKGPIVTTVDTIVITQKNTSPVNPQADSLENDIIPPPEKETGNPFKGTKIIQQGLAYQVKKIVKNLDNLKGMGGQSRDKAEKSKRKFVQDSIEPDVRTIGTKVVEKKKDVASILDMLRSANTVKSTNKGKATPGSKKHIEQIKNKVLGLCPNDK